MEEERRVKVVLNRWGKPSIQSGKKFFSIPAGKEPTELTLEECLIIAGIKKPSKKKEKTEKAKPAAKKTSAAKAAKPKAAPKAKKK